MNRKYDLVVILDPEKTSEEQEKLLAKIKKVITDAEGKVSEIKQLGKKDLAYPVLKRKTGIFVEIEFDSPSASTAAITQKMRLEESILRYLLVNSE